MKNLLPKRRRKPSMKQLTQENAAMNTALALKSETIDGLKSMVQTLEDKLHWVQRQSTQNAPTATEIFERDNDISRLESQLADAEAHVMELKSANDELRKLNNSSIAFIRDYLSCFGT